MRATDGIYNARAVPLASGKYAELGVSKRKKSHQILMMFKLADGPNKGATLPWFGYFSKESAERTVSALRLCGFEGQDILDVENQTLDESVQVTVETAEFEGKTQTRVSWVNDPNYVPTIELEPLSAKGKAALKTALEDIL